MGEAKRREQQGLAPKTKKEKARQSRETARLLTKKMAKLRAEPAENKSNSNVRVGVYTNRNLLRLPTINEEGRKRKGSKKGKKGRPVVQKKSRKKKN